MKGGVFAVVFGALPFEKMLDYVQSVGVEAVEIGCGGYVGDAHYDEIAGRGDALVFF